MTKPTPDVRAALARVVAEAKKTARTGRALKQALRQAGIDPDRRVDLADVRAAVRNAVVSAEAEKRAAASTDRMLRVAEVMRLTGLGRTTLWQLERAGRFPQRVRPLGNRAVRWRESEVRRWIAERTAKGMA